MYLNYLAMLLFTPQLMMLSMVLLNHSAKAGLKNGRKNVKFKIIEFGTSNVELLAHIVDQSGKNHSWVSFFNGELYNKNVKKKALQPLIKAELKVMDLQFEGKNHH